MSINAYPIGGAGRAVLLGLDATETVRTGEFPGQAEILVATMVADHNGRPSVQLVGQVRALQVGAERVDLREGSFLAMWDYQFTRAQLVELVQRGLLETGVGDQPMASLLGEHLVLPVPTKLSMLTLGEADYLFASRMPGAEPGLITVDNCGVDLTRYFPESAEIDLLAQRRELEVARQAGITGVDLLFEDEPLPAPVVPADPGSEGRADFEAAALELARTEEAPVLDQTLEPLGVDGALRAPEADGLDNWFTPASAQPFPVGPEATSDEVRAALVADRVDEEAAAEEAEAQQTALKAQAEDTKRAAWRSQQAQGLGHVPSAYQPHPDEPGLVEDAFEELEF